MAPGLMAVQDRSWALPMVHKVPLTVRTPLSCRLVLLYVCQCHTYECKLVCDQARTFFKL